MCSRKVNRKTETTFSLWMFSGNTFPYWHGGEPHEISVILWGMGADTYHIEGLELDSAAQEEGRN